MSSILLLLLLQTSAVTADDRCYAGAATQAEINQCARASLKAADSRLEALVRSYADNLMPEQLKLFHTAQLDWQRFRQSSCKFAASDDSGGSSYGAYSMVIDQCLASMAESRIAEIKALVNCPEGDMGCSSYSGVTPNNSFKPNPLRGSA